MNHLDKVWHNHKDWYHLKLVEIQIHHHLILIDYHLNNNF